MDDYEWIPWDTDDPIDFENWFLGDDHEDVAVPWSEGCADEDPDFAANLDPSEYADPDSQKFRGRLELQRGEPPDKRPADCRRVYHLTSLTNLAKIVETGELRCYSKLRDPLTVGSGDLTRRRSKITVDGRPLAEYVSYYFSPFTPMLYWVACQSDRDLDEMVILASAPEVIATSTKIAFTNGHSMSDRYDTRFYTSLSHLAAVDFELIKGGNWNDPDEETKRQRRWRYQAEFLALRAVPIQAIEEAGCLSDSGTAQARDLLTGTCPVRFLTEIRSNLDAGRQRNDIAG